MKNAPVPDFGLNVDLPERPEADATGETARIYGEIRRLGGVPMVALIFRHFATLPGALDWAWAAVGPAWRTGRLQEAAWSIARAAPLAPLAPFTAAELAGAGIDDAARREIQWVIEAYDRANPENLLTVLCLLRLAAGRTAVRAMQASAWTPPAVPGPLAPMGNPASQPPPVDALLARVAEPGTNGGHRVVQSLYRHFLHRPAFLELVVERMVPRREDGSVDAAAADIRDRMGREADAIVECLSAPPSPHPGLALAATRFGGGVIPRMIVVGRLLRGAVEGAAR